MEHGGHGGGTNGPVVADIYKWMYGRGYFTEDGNTTKVNEVNATETVEANGTQAESEVDSSEAPKIRNVIKLSDSPQ